MADSYIQVAPDGAGKFMQTFVNTIAGTLVHAEAVAFVNPSGISILGTASTPSSDVLTVQRPSVTQTVSTAFEASRVLKSSAGQLIQLSIFNSKASAQFILLMNATSLPSNGAVTLLYPPIPIAAATLLVLDLPAPLVASIGIVVCNSSTGSFTKTIGSADCAFYAQVN